MYTFFKHCKLPYITCLREAHSVAMRKHFSFAFVPFFLLQLNFFPLRLRHPLTRTAPMELRRFQATSPNPKP